MPAQGSARARKPSVIEEWKYYVALAVAGTLLWGGAYLAIVSGKSVRELGGGDDRWYVRMAENPFVFVDSPFGFGFRVITPLLVWSVGNVRWGFPLVNGLASVLLVLLFYRYLREFFPIPTAALGVGLLLVSGTTRSLILSPYLTDAIPHALVVAALLALAGSRYGVAAGLLCVGVLGKETVLFVLPVLVLSAWRRGQFGRLGVWFAFLAPVAAHVVFRHTGLWFGTVPPSYNYLSIDNVYWAVTTQLQWASIEKSLLSVFVYSFGIAWIMAIAGFRGAAPFLQSAAAYVCLSLASLLVTADWGRVGSFGFVGVIPLACALPVRRVAGGLLVGLTGLLNFGVFFLGGGPLKYALAATLIGSETAIVLAERGVRPDRPEERAMSS
jgi:hypothetical protein